MQQKPPFILALNIHESKMREGRVVAKKHLGQNFLHDLNVVRRIVSSLELAATDIVLEIGCGRGALTRHIVSKSELFIGVELDKSLFPKLSAQYSSPSALFLNQDILQLDLSELMHRRDQPRAKVKVVGNLPYYISSPIIEWLGRQAGMIESATIMLQVEVADRLMASPGSKEFGVLSLVASYYFTVTKLMDVRPGAFRPVPKVSSTLLRLKPKIQQTLDLKEEMALFGFIKQSFSQRRKTLWNCLKGSVDKRRLEAMLRHLGHGPNSRAETLSIEDFVSLYKELRTSDPRQL
jgi:16S rRNA (adenine1518-N6/adenine1519-N6)-dimethyltransferase